MCLTIKKWSPGSKLKFLHCLFILGEVFVLNDGGEVDLDLGNYERFLDINLYKDNNITTGKIYQHVINKERRGDYLGKTVQGIIFHEHWEALSTHTLLKIDVTMTKSLDCTSSNPLQIPAFFSFSFFLKVSSSSSMFLIVFSSVFFFLFY